MTEYEQARNKLIELLRDDLIEQCDISDFPERTLKFKIKGEKHPLIFTGSYTKELALYFFKQKHKKDSHPDMLRRCPKCNLRASIHYYDDVVQCHTCDYKTDLKTWNNENPHLKFKE